MSSELQLFIVIGFVLFFILLAGYYLIFLKKAEEPKWKLSLAKKFKALKAQDLSKKMYLIELDKLLEFALKKKFRENNSLGNLLKEHGKSFSKDVLNEVWSAHKIRNKLVHDVDFEANPSELNHAIIVMKKVISKIIE